MEGACFAVNLVAGEGPFQGGEGIRTESNVSKDLAKIVWFEDVDSGQRKL